MKGIILAGGSGTRLYPMTQVVSKQLQPLYDKPMIFYPLSLLMLSDVSEILIISTVRDTPYFEQLLGTGEELGLNIKYKVQNAPNGLAEAFILGEEFIGNDDVTLMLGDNLFYGDIDFLRTTLTEQKEHKDGKNARIFAYYVEDPSSYGVVEFEKETRKILSIEEKPVKPKSHYAVPGVYVFGSDCVKRAKELKPSKRGELEIIDLIKSYWNDDQLALQIIGRGVSWLDTGTPDQLLAASQMIQQIQHRQGLKVACLQEIALRRGLITEQQYMRAVELVPPSPYRQYLLQVLEDYK